LLIILLKANRVAYFIILDEMKLVIFHEKKFG